MAGGVGWGARGDKNEIPQLLELHSPTPQLLQPERCCCCAAAHCCCCCCRRNEFFTMRLLATFIGEYWYTAVQQQTSTYEYCKNALSNIFCPPDLYPDPCPTQRIPPPPPRVTAAAAAGPGIFLATTTARLTASASCLRRRTPSRKSTRRSRVQVRARALLLLLYHSNRLEHCVYDMSGTFLCSTYVMGVTGGHWGTAAAPIVLPVPSETCCTFYLLIRYQVRPIIPLVYEAPNLVVLCFLWPAGWG